jgi:hypothetical protein
MIIDNFLNEKLYTLFDNAGFLILFRLNQENLNINGKKNQINYGIF